LKRNPEPEISGIRIFYYLPIKVIFWLYNYNLKNLQVNGWHFFFSYYIIFALTCLAALLFLFLPMQLM